MTITLNSYAKLNLDLNVIGKHDFKPLHIISSTMVRIDIFATLIIDIHASSGFCSSLNVEGYEHQEWFDPIKKLIGLWSYERQCPVDIKITIENPIRPFSGLGGMSSYVATVFNALEYFYCTQHKKENPEYLSVYKENDIGLRCGSDVPFFLSKCNKAHVQGVGEIITPLEPERKNVLIHFPDYTVSTEKAYADLDKLKSNNFLDLKENKAYYEYLSNKTGKNNWKLSGSGSTFFLYDVDKNTIKEANNEWTKKNIYCTLSSTLDN